MFAVTYRWQLRLIVSVPYRWQLRLVCWSLPEYITPFFDYFDNVEGRPLKTVEKHPL